MHVRHRHAEQFSRPRSAGQKHTDQRPVPVAIQLREQFVKDHVRNGARFEQRLFLPIEPTSVQREGIHRIVMGVETTAVARLRRNWRHHRAGARVHVEVIEHRQHRKRVVDRRGRIALRQILLAGPGIHRTRRWSVLPPSNPCRVRRRPQPQHEIPHVTALGTIPDNPHRGQEPPPPQQVVTVGPTRRRTIATGDQITKKIADRPDRTTRAVDHHPRERPVAGRHHPPDPSHIQTGDLRPHRLLIHRTSKFPNNLGGNRSRSRHPSGGGHAVSAVNRSMNRLARKRHPEAEQITGHQLSAEPDRDVAEVDLGFLPGRCVCGMKAFAGPRPAAARICGLRSRTYRPSTEYDTSVIPCSSINR